MDYKEVEIIFDPNGTVSVDQIGWKGVKCENAVNDLIKALGRETSVSRKQEHGIPQRVQIRE